MPTVISGAAEAGGVPGAEAAKPKLAVAPPKVPTNAPVPVPGAALPPGSKRPRSRTKTLVLAAAALIVVGGIGAGYFLFMKEPPPPPPVVRQATPKAPAPAAAGGETASSSMGKAVEKAANVAAGARSGIAATDGLLETTTKAPGAVAAGPPTPAAPAATAGTAAAAVAPANEPVAAPPSAAFRNWVNAARITGAIGSRNPPRAIINGKPLDAGMAADDALGITFETIEIVNGVQFLVFKDKTGAIVRRRN